MSNTPQTQPSKASQKPSLLPTLLDYGFLIFLAIASASFALYYLTQYQTQTVTKPSPRLEEVFKP